jgi:hypothetical protein
MDTDHTLFSTRFWHALTPEEQLRFSSALHLLPTKDGVRAHNIQSLSTLGVPVVKCIARHTGGPEAKKASDEDAEGLQKEILLAEGAKIMITRNVWTSKGKFSSSLNLSLTEIDSGLVNGAQGIVKKIWYHPGSNPRVNLPSVVFVQCAGYSGN